MIQSNSWGGENSGERIIGADMPIDTARYPVEQLLKAFHKLSITQQNIKLVLSGQRSQDEIYSVWNFIDQHNLTERVEFIPYYERCDRYPLKKQDCDVWISRNTPSKLITADYLLNRLSDGSQCDRKYAMFFTCFHPEKQEGNSTLMRLWLDHMKRAGYITHLVYYMYDAGAVTADMRRKALHQFDLYKEIPVRSKLTGANYNGLNVHVDDWCGIEAMEAVDKLCHQHEYDIAVTNYPFMSAIFDRVSAYTNKVLLTHDSFVDRNRKMLEQGYPESGWVSIDKKGEQLACDRSDVVVAMQEHEADEFREGDNAEKVCVVAPIFEKKQIEHCARSEKLKVGYFGSSNWVNEQNLGEYLKHWANDEELRNNSEILIAGGVCETLKDFVPSSLLTKINPTMIGRVNKAGDFFAQCDVIINPERGGTGIKIKTLEALAHSMPVLTTVGGSVGIDSRHPLHHASSFEELATFTKQLLNKPDAIEELRSACISTYDQYLELQTKRMNELLGEPIETSEDSTLDDDSIDDSIPIITEPKPLKKTKKTMRVPQYVRETAAEYHFEEFERFLSQEDIRGKRVLEIGSDFHLASARLFMANGADSVVATNIGDWKSDEPMPEGVEFQVCDASDAELEKESFDIIYGIAIIEHVPDFKKLCASLKKFLKPDGVIYFQGCPLWAGTLGHHVWYSPETVEFEKVFATGGGKKTKPMQYSFTDNNPIPDWAHLAMSPEELETLLIDDGVPDTHAAGIVQYVHNLDGTMVGSCSNFFSASEVLEVMNTAFDVEVDRITSKNKPNEYFHIAREHYSEEDLRTLGLRVWMKHKGAQRTVTPQQLNPKVSVIIPFYGVEPYIEDCIQSVLQQDYPNIEAIFIDDQSKDGSRMIVEQYATKDDRIRLVTHDQNQGLGPARNTGVNNADGEFLLFLDSDDYFSTKHAISTLVREARSTGCPVVIGSCDRIMTNGERLDFDRAFDASHGGIPDTIVTGEQAYLGSSFIPGAQYVPMRAWGTLIDRFVYLDSGLEYPAGEHEDLPHTPFMYNFAEKVLYISDIVVTYRDRSDSLSNTGWDSAKILRQGEIWKNIRENVTKHGLEKHAGDTAVKTAEHLIMKLRQNGIKSGAEQAAFDVLEEILKDAQGELNESLLFYMLDSLRGILDFQKYDYTLYHKLTGHISPAYMIKYYRHRIGTGLSDHGPVPVSAERDTSILPDIEPASTNQTDTESFNKDHGRPSALASNEMKAHEQLKQFEKRAPKKLKKFPSMLTDGDKALYFDAGLNYQFKGSIVDAGCFVGGTTMSLVQGLLQNPLYDSHKAQAEKLIRVYDLFEIDDDYILGHLRKNYPKHDFTNQKSFLEVFNENLHDYSNMLDVRAGDVITAGYADDSQIEILGVDLCKALPVTDFVVREFFPRLMERALVMQQDFIHQYHPHIHLSMLILEDHFDLDLEVKWGGSVSYTLKKQITPELIEARFGSDSNWYNNVPRNEMLLRKLESDMLYDENRWVIMQVLGLYYWSMSEHSKAKNMYNEASRLFPQFDMPDEVRRLIGS
jgi:glycosyltransferase involved in cell wall biosynthesis/SAM-dependent methyltransferase